MLVAPAFDETTGGEEPPRCAPGDLQAEAGWQGATGSMLGGVGFLNLSESDCVLARPRSVDIVDDTGSLLLVEQRWDDDGDDVAVFQPGERVWLPIQRWNWCGARPLGAQWLRIEFLADG